MIGNIIDVLFFALCIVVFGTIIWYNITEIFKVRRNLKKQEKR